MSSGDRGGLGVRYLDLVGKRAIKGGHEDEWLGCDISGRNGLSHGETTTRNEEETDRRGFYRVE